MPENFIDGCFVYIHKKKLIILLILLSAVSIGFCFVVLPKIMADKPKKIIVNEPCLLYTSWVKLELKLFIETSDLNC